jgi:hypothetical protein
MIDDSVQRKQPERRPRRNLAHLIKWIILILLVLLVVAQLATGELDQLRERVASSWLILLLKLVLIAIVIYLMRVQRSLRCEITEPKGCAALEYDAATDSAVVVVRGTAAGSIFASYDLALELSGTPMTVTVDYPGGGGSGVTPVTGGELGRIHVETLEPTTGYKVILTVHDTAGGTKTCTSLFDLQDKVVYIEAIGAVPAQTVGAHPGDPSQPLKLVKETPGAPSVPDDPEDSVGGSISVEGGADVFGCDRQMNEWALHYRPVASGNDPWQADAAGVWDDIRVLPIWNADPNHPRRYLSLLNLIPNFVLHGELTRQWTPRQVLQSLFPVTYAARRVTTPADWNTAGALLNGRYTVRLRVKHDQMAGGGPIQELYDAATVWIDNRQILGRITALAVAGGGTLTACEELRLSQFVAGGSKLDMEIIGRAWDPIIVDTYPKTVPPNDNFGHYDLSFKKDGSSSWLSIASHETTPVPADRELTLPAPPNDVGTLASWDVVGALDAGPAPPGGAPPAAYPKLYRGDRCAFLIRLYVTDKTWINDKGDRHDVQFDWPFCIENDLPPGAPFPVP